MTAFETLPIDSLIPYEWNNKVHGDAEVDRVANSINEFGWTYPILIDEKNVLLAGHKRLFAARKLGLADVPILRKEGLTETQKRAYRIIDNKASEESPWNFPALEQELQRLAEDGFSLDSFCNQFAFPELEDDAEATEDEYEVPDDVETRIKRGDLIELRSHRVLCGDSTEPKNVAELMGGKTVDLIITSPPYAQQREYGGNLQPWDSLMQGVFRNVPTTAGAQLLINLGMVHREGEWMPYWQNWIEWMREQGWRRFGWYVWDQGFGLPGDWNGRFSPSHEFVFHFNKESVRPNKIIDCKWAGSEQTGKGLRGNNGVVQQWCHQGEPIQSHKIPDSVIRVTRQTGAIGEGLDHPAPFSLGLPTFLLKSFGGDCYEPFLGSGTTLIACEQLNRVCYGMELEPKYCQVIIDRYQAHCEKEGKPFECSINGDPYHG